MKRRSFFERLLQHNTRHPQGFWGRFMLRGMNRGHAPLHRWGISHLSWQPDWRVLDIGCGGGALLKRLLELSPESRVWGVDRSAESVAFARKVNRRELDRRCFIEQASADALPLASSSVDVVTAFESVYFWEDLPRAFSEVARVLRPGGCFLICCEAGDPSDPRWERWTRRIEGMKIHSVETLRRHLTAAGFDDIVEHVHPRGCLCLVAHRSR